MDRKKRNATSPCSSSASMSSKENVIEKIRPQIVCNTHLDTCEDSMGSTSDGTPTFRTPLEAAMMQHKTFKQQEQPGSSFANTSSQPLNHIGSFQSKLSSQPNLQFEKFPSTGGGGFRVNTFEMVAEDSWCDSDRPSLIGQQLERESVLSSYQQFKPIYDNSSLATYAPDSYNHTQRLSEPNKITSGEHGMVLDQQTPLMMMKRHQMETAAPLNQGHGSIAASVQQVTAIQSHPISKNQWNTAANGCRIISQTCDSSSAGYQSSDQERLSLFSKQSQSRGINSDELLLYQQQSQSSQLSFGDDAKQNFVTQKQTPLDLINAQAKQFYMKPPTDGEQKQTAESHCGTSTTTGTRTTGGTTYNSECSSPKLVNGNLPFSQATNFGQIQTVAAPQSASVQHHLVVPTEQRDKLIELQNQLMIGLGNSLQKSQYVMQQSNNNNNKPPLSPFAKNINKFQTKQSADFEHQQHQYLNNVPNTYLSPPIHKVQHQSCFLNSTNAVGGGHSVDNPFKISLIHNPSYQANEQNKQQICSKEDKQFLEDLQVIQDANNQISLKKDRKKKNKTLKKSNLKQNAPKPNFSMAPFGSNLSQDGNKAQSFKSVTSYVLGDLDISSNGEASSDLASYEISSNSSSINSDQNSELNQEFISDKKDKTGKNKREPYTAASKNAKIKKRFQEDDELNSGYLANEAYQGFIAEKSPLSFKNPIFFSCPNSKFAFNRNINTSDLQSKRQLFADNTIAQNQPPLFFNQEQIMVEQRMAASRIPLMNYQAPLTQVKVHHNLQYPNMGSNNKFAVQHQKMIPILDLKSSVQCPMDIVKSQQQSLYNNLLKMPVQVINERPIENRRRRTASWLGASGSSCEDDFDLGNQKDRLQKLCVVERKMRDDAVESPTSKNKYKGVAKFVEELEKGNEVNFGELVTETLTKVLTLDIPKKILWRLFLDMADYAKRDSKFDCARQLYKIVVSTQPYAYQGWLEYAKMEEECGNQEESNAILLKSLKFNKLNENLFVKVIKYEEKKDNLQNIVNLIESVKANCEGQIDQIWRILLEGALAQGRLGSRTDARNQFKYLMLNCKNNGAVFLDASRFEERENQLEEAINICEQGLECNVKHTPLWFQYLKLYEKVDETMRQSKFDRFSYIIKDMYRNIGKDYHWKINVELAQTYDRIGDEQRTKEYLSTVTTDCPDSVKWKIWLIAARIMLNQGQIVQARLCIERSCMEVPLKQISVCLLEYAKYYEMIGEYSRALELMNRIRSQSNAEWKIQFEAVMMYMRMGKFREAEAIVKDSLKHYFAKGRLWAVLIQLQHQRACTEEDFREVHQTFKLAVNEISKSGEVWCEGARLCLTSHPCNPFFDLQLALQYLDFAVQFTPQYGDSFLEVIRACYIVKGMQQSGKLPKDKLALSHDPDQLLKKTKLNCLHSEPNYGVLWFYYKNSMVDNAIDIWKNACEIIQMELNDDLNFSLQSQSKATNWLGSRRLNVLMENGMQVGGSTRDGRQCTNSEKIRVVYGFEQILPQNSSKKGEN